ncbi:type IV secretion system DNA-binding domain-containing protein [Pelagibacterium sp. 26DY04]|nr:type IV secretion system DNA-binding domain-containing protein [Pelagibacterium sp. 26DY04]WMT85527.1 type IV secretion system DNA-binding domain-containing protein [Pelagibacterium sp. 26DY04]|tara:strand:+ start:547 stop:2304 length:1758 start_codon:yes stop_codon:yes gene_type:complete
MSNKDHDLTPVPDVWPGRRAAFGASVLIGLIVAAFLFGVLPVYGWNSTAASIMVLGHEGLLSIIGLAAMDATPKLADAANPVERLIMLPFNGMLWLAYPISFVLALPARLVEWDLLADISLRLSGTAAASLAAAILVFRHVVNRAPYRRRATWVDGPQVRWFSDAVAGASNHLRRLVAEAGRGVKLAPGLFLPRRAEHESMFILGLPGSGKSVIAEGLMRQAIERGDRLLCVDVKGNLIDRMVRLFGKTVANVVGMEPGGGIWAIGGDVTSRMTASRVAALLIPASKDPVWSAASRLLLAALLVKLVQSRGRSWGWTEIRQSISRPVEEIAAELAPTMRQVAEMLRGRDGEPSSMALSTLFNMVSHIDDLVQTCADLEAEGWPRVSLRAWITGKGRRVLILRHDLGNRELSGRLLAAMVRAVSSDLLSRHLEDNIDHGIWIFADELPRIGTAAKDVSDLASLGRSRGIRVVASAQSQAQLEEKMSPAAAEALTENFGKVIVCKVRPGKSAERISTSMVGSATYAIRSGKDETQTLHQVAAFSASQMTRTLGLTIDWRGGKSIRAAVIGLDDVYVVEWKFSDWPGL